MVAWESAVEKSRRKRAPAVWLAVILAFLMALTCSSCGGVQTTTHAKASAGTSPATTTPGTPVTAPQAAPVTTSAKLTARFLNVGEADSCILKAEDNGQTFFALVDTGRSGASGYIASELKAMGCGEINVMVLTHPDADHVGSAASLMDTFKVDQVWDPGVDNPTKTWHNVVATIGAKGIPVEHPHAGEVDDWDGVQTEVLNPPAGKTYPDTNDYSIVLVEALGSEDIMLPGDAQAAAQQFMMTESTPSIAVFKVPHHGAASGYYAPFFNKVHPANSVISVGPNSYGHPSQTVENALSALGTVYRTDQNGDVTVDATTDSLQISAQSNPSATPAPSPAPGPSSSTSQGPFWGSRNSNIYHYPSCTWAQKISPANLVVFPTAQDAVNAGYRPCKVCKPPSP